MKISSMNLDKILAMTPEQKWDFVCGDIKDDGQFADVALILGCWPEIAIERAKAAVDLYHAGRAKYIVASGGVKWDYNGEQISEADLMKRILLEGGVPEDAIILDNEARTTIENMICGTLVLNRMKEFSSFKSIIIVTSQNHMQRSLALAKAFLPRKFEISGYPSYQEKSMTEWLLIEKNRTILNQCISLTKGLVDNGIVEDVEIDMERVLSV